MFSHRKSMLKIDGVEVFVCSVHSVFDRHGLVRVKVKPIGMMGGSRSQHYIPPEGKFRTNGHTYEWCRSVGISGERG